MKQIDRYNILEQFHKEAHQTIYMAIDKEKEHEVALVNTIDRNSVLTDDAFNELVRHLSNVSYYDLSDKLVLVTNYNAGIPLITYLHNYQTDEEARLNLLSECLKKSCDYETLPSTFQSVLIDSHQIVIYKKEVFFNEVILLRDLQNAVDFHGKIQDLAFVILGDSKGVMSKHVFSFFNSTAFFSNPSIKNIYSQFLKLRSGDTMVLVDPVSHNVSDNLVVTAIPISIAKQDDVTAMPISLAKQGNEGFVQLAMDEPTEQALQPQPQPIQPLPLPFETTTSSTPNQYSEIPETSEPLQVIDIPATMDSPPPFQVPADISNQPTSDPIQQPKLVNTTAIPSELHIGLTERRTNFKTDQPKTKWHFPWLMLIFLAMVGFGWWYIFIHEELPNPPIASYEMITTDTGWQFTSRAIAYAPATIKDYQWTVLLNGETIETHNTERFLFNPTKSGSYIISLSVTDSYKQKSQGFSNTLQFEAKDGGAETPNTSDLSELPESFTPGEILEDLKVFQTAPSSQRISIPSSKLYGIASKKDTLVNKGDLMSIWLKTSDLKPVSILLIGYKDGVKSYETHWTFKPSVLNFELVSHTFDASSLDQVDLFIQSDNVYVWFDAFNLETIK